MAARIAPLGLRLGAGSQLAVTRACPSLSRTPVLRLSPALPSAVSRPGNEPGQLRIEGPRTSVHSGALRLHPQALSSELPTASTAQQLQQQQERPRVSEGSWQLKILYDGDCPICMREVDFLQRRNEKYGTLKFVDISAPGYAAADNAGVTFEEAMGHIHGITREGEVFTGVEAFRKFYEAVGLGWVYAVTKLKPAQVVADAVYEIWAKYRLPLSGRPSLDAIIEERRRAKEGVKGCDEEEECVAPW